MLKTLLTWILKYRSGFQRSQSSKGFTLMELLIAASMTLLVVGIAGWALSTIVKSNKIAKATSEMQYDYNRAVEFMTEEIKGAKNIRTDLETHLSSFAPDFQQEDWKIPVIAFRVEQVDNEDEKYVVYYVVDTEASPESEPWAGRYVLYRWGPTFNSDGTYKLDSEDGDDDDGDGVTNEIVPPNTWSGTALVDLLLGTWVEVGEDKRLCRRPYEATEGWTRYPSNDDDVKGFFVCVPTAGNMRGEQAEIHLYGQIRAEGSDNAYLQNSHLNYGVVTNVTIRGGEVSLFSGGEEIISSISGFNNPTGGDNPDYVPNDDSDTTITYVHSDGNCEGYLYLNDGDLAAADASVSYESPVSDSVAIPAGEPFFLEAFGDICGTSGIPSTARSNYRVGTNGMMLKDITGEDSNSDPNANHLRSILLSYNYNPPLVNNEGMLTLGPDQFLAFFEYSPDGVISGAESSPYDFDDLIMLVEVESAAP